MAGMHFRDLVAWQQSMLLAEAVYRSTRAFPDDERFGLVSQMRRASVSIPSNIAEGQNRRTRGDLRRGVALALGSLGELETQAELARRLGFLSEASSRTLEHQFAELGRVLSGLLKSMGPHTSY